MGSLASKINSIATMFTPDFYVKVTGEQSEAKLVGVGRSGAPPAVIVAIAVPLGDAL